MKIILDELDKAIISELIDDAKISSKELAKKLHVHPNTLLQRIKRLEREGAILRYTIVPNYDAIGFEFYAVIGIKTKMQKDWEEKLRPVVKKIPQIEAFLLVTGESDALAIVRMTNKNELSTVLREIQNSGIVEKTSTYLVLDGYKFHYQFNPFKMLSKRQ